MSILKTDLESDLISKLEPVLSSLGYDLRDVTMTEGQNATIRVTIDSLDAEKKIGIEDCTKVHETIGPMFDVWDPVKTAYTLEVSSPGEKAPLRTKEHFEAVIEEEIEFKTVDALVLENSEAKPRRNWKGLLKSVGEDFVLIEDYLGSHQVYFKQIKSAKCLRIWSKAKH